MEFFPPFGGFPRDGIDFMKRLNAYFKRVKGLRDYLVVAFQQCLKKTERPNGCCPQLPGEFFGAGKALFTNLASVNHLILSVFIASLTHKAPNPSAQLYPVKLTS